MSVNLSRALRALARHDGTARVSNRTAERSGLVEWHALKVLIDEGLACHTPTNRFGLTAAGRKIAAELRAS